MSLPRSAIALRRPPPGRTTLLAAPQVNDKSPAAGQWLRRLPVRLTETCSKLSVLPSPLWGGVEGGGRGISPPTVRNAPPPSPTLPHKGGGSRPSLRRVLSIHDRHAL